ncbi:MAG: tetratricopeptide repeat protein [Verrucomicrobiae bacterium]|nr:tetratricopeptide repeat protein [Verrucomicrobiae bacterium]
MNETDEIPDLTQCMMRARSLMEHSRYADAAEWLQRGLQMRPDDAACHSLLAACLINLEGREQQAVTVARRGVELEPEESFAHAIFALALARSAKDGQNSVIQEALVEAQESVRLDPDSDFAQTTMAQMLIRLRRWNEAEIASRKALELDPEDAAAAELLSICLLHEGKHEDNDQLVQYQLQKNAENDSAHSAAGWNALRKGDYRKANGHFLEALRLNPMHEGARQGLVESYRARSFFYRNLLRFDAFLNRLTAGRQMAFWLGGYVIYRLLYGVLSKTAPWLASILVGSWLVLVFWSALARGLSSLALLFDRYARRSLMTREKWEGVVVGGMAVLALVFLTASWVVAPGLRLFALCIFIGAIPAASAFTNDHYIGKWFYWAVAVFCILCAFYPVAALGALWAFGVRFPMTSQIMLCGIYTAVAFTFVRFFGIGYR